MSKIIYKLKENSFNRVKKYSRVCPICGANLYTVDNIMDDVMDGNMVVHCENDETHVFWQNARESLDILHLNINSNSTNFKSDKDYEWDGKQWNVC